MTLVLKITHVLKIDSLLGRRFDRRPWLFGFRRYLLLETGSQVVETQLLLPALIAEFA